MEETNYYAGHNWLTIEDDSPSPTTGAQVNTNFPWHATALSQQFALHGVIRYGS